MKKNLILKTFARMEYKMEYVALATIVMLWGSAALASVSIWRD